VRCNRNEQTQASVKVVAVLRTWGRSVMVRGRYYHSPIASSIRPSPPTKSFARVAKQPPLRIRPSAPCQRSMAKRRGGLQTVRASPRVSVTSVNSNSSELSVLHRQVSSKVRASMLCSLPFLRRSCPPVPHDVPENPLDVFSSSATSRLIALKLHH